LIIKNTDGSETFYREFGNPANEAMVLLHGIGADHNMWRPQMEEFAGNGFSVLVPDLLGHGKSSKVERLELRDWERQIGDLLRESQKERCILVGVSMGGVIAQSFAVNNPEAVGRLILSDTFGELKTFKERLLGISQVVGFRLYKMLGAKMLARGMAAAYKASFAEQARDYFREVSLDADFDQLILARKAINQIDVIERLREIDIRTLVIVGDQFGKSFIEVNRKIANAVKGSRFVVLHKAMDPSNLVNPAGFNQEVLTFLREYPA
jgi:pimeloyl-ACP methyl ester carboxylesterase